MPISWENGAMNTLTVPFSDVIPPELEADTEAVIAKLMTGKQLDPETYQRIRARSEKITEEVRKKHGILNIAVDLIRDCRESE
jgi:hypothetical protein